MKSENTEFYKCNIYTFNYFIYKYNISVRPKTDSYFSSRMEDCVKMINTNKYKFF